MLLYFKFKGHYFPPCAPPLLAPLTLPFKNFNRTTFTTYYIKKTAANLTSKRVFLMLTAPFCFIKILFIKLSRFITILSLKKITGLQDVLKYYRSASLKRLRNIAVGVFPKNTKILKLNRVDHSHGTLNHLTTLPTNVTVRRSC